MVIIKQRITTTKHMHMRSKAQHAHAMSFDDCIRYPPFLHVPKTFNRSQVRATLTSRTQHTHTHTPLLSPP